MHLTLFVPELLWPEPDDHPTSATTACPTLEALLARGRFVRTSAQAAEDALCALFRPEASLSQGAVRRLGEDDAPGVAEERWLCADPVHLRFRDERLTLADSTRFEASRDEAQQLVAALNAELPEIGCFHAASPDRWYLRLAKDTGLPPLDAPPLSAVAGRHVGQLLPDVLTDRNWRRHLNAIQTVLHAHPVNRQREDEGRMTLNSLWLWGDRFPPSAGTTAFDAVWSGDTLACGLARATGIPTRERPPNAAALLAHPTPGTTLLVVLDDLQAPARYDEGSSWLARIAAFEADWFTPLQTALASGKLRRLEIVTPTAYGRLYWECRRSDRWKHWRRARPLAAMAARLAQPGKETE